MTGPTPPPAPADALTAALIELEHHAAVSGWEQPPRLFALVRTDDLVAAEPELAVQLGLRASDDGGAAGALTAIEQEQFHAGDDLIGALEAIEWPPTVHGCAVSCVRTFLPAGQEGELPDDPAAAAAYVDAHPGRQQVRVVVGALRGGVQHGVARLASHPDELLGGDDLVPGLSVALTRTLAAS